MWKKDEAQEQMTPSSHQTGPAVRSESPARPQAGGGERATIGRSITIRGDVSGDEDLVIQGRVEGTVDLEKHALTIGPEGKVKADVTGRKVTVEGEIVGNLRALEHVILRSSARVEGDVTAPRVVIEDGAVFRGGIDMGDKHERAEKIGGDVAVVRPGPAAVPAPAVASGAGAKASAKG